MLRRLQPGLSLLVPLWLVVGWSVFRGGWELVLVLLGAGLLLVVFIVFGLLSYLRPRSRGRRRFTWLDFAVFGLMDGLGIAIGFGTVASGWLAIALIAVIVVGGWLLTREFLEAGRELLDDLAGDYASRTGQGPSDVEDRGEAEVTVIEVEPKPKDPR